MIVFVDEQEIECTQVDIEHGIREWSENGVRMAELNGHSTIIVYLNEIPAPMELGTWWCVNGQMGYLTQFGKELHFEVTG